jgi:hypothetical protein
MFHWHWSFWKLFTRKTKRKDTWKKKNTERQQSKIWLKSSLPKLLQHKVERNTAEHIIALTAWLTSCIFEHVYMYCFISSNSTECPRKKLARSWLHVCCIAVSELHK